MKFTTLGLILMCWQSCTIETHSYVLYAEPLRTKVEDALEGFKPILKTGNESLGIPAIDPLNVDQLPININTTQIQMDALLTKIYVPGLSDYKVNSGDLELFALKIKANLTWPLIPVSLNYTMKGKGGEMEIYGTGDINMAVKNLTIAVEISFKLNGQYLTVKSVELKLTLEAFDFKITGFLDNEDLSEIAGILVSGLVPQFIEQNHDMIAKEGSSMITGVLDNWLSDKTLSDLLRMFS